MRHFLAFLTLGIVLGFAASLLAAESNERARVARNREVSFTSVAGVITETYPGGSTFPNRASYVTVATVNGMPVAALVRVTEHSRGLFVDLVLDSDVANLSSRATALAITGVNHPAAARDAEDTVALVAAGGS